MDTKGGKAAGGGGGGGGVMNWQIGIDIYTLICIKWMTNKNLLYKKINKIQKKKNKNQRDFPGGTVDKTLCSHCKGPGFDPWSGN